MTRIFPVRMRVVTLLALTMLLAVALVGAVWRGADDGELQASALDAYYTGWIAVNVTDEVGRPIAGATVKVFGNTTNFPLTDATGSLLISGLLADVNGTYYTVWAEKAGYDASSLTYVNVTPDNISYVDLVIHGGLILGTVSDLDGPIAGAIVSIATLGFSNVTGSDGGYWLYEVPMGVTYSVTASATGYDNQTREVVVPTTGVAALSFILASKTGSISGTVYHATTMEPLEGATVSVGVGDIVVTVTSDADGTYRIPNLPSGTYSLTATLSGFNSTTLSNIAVVKDIETAGVDFLLDEKPTRLYGVVKSGTYLLPGANVSVQGTVLYSITSANGEYEIRNIPAGTYALLVVREGYTTITVAGVVIPRGGETQQNIELVGFPGALRGIVHASYDTSLPLVGVTVTISDPNGDLSSTTTNINGEFEFRGLGAGNYTIYFELEGYKPVELGPISVDPEGSVVLDRVLLEPLPEDFGGFIFGFDLAHSMMVIALALTIAIMALAVALRIKTFEAPNKSPAVYDQAEEEPEKQQEVEKESGGKE